MSGILWVASGYCLQSLCSGRHNCRGIFRNKYSEEGDNLMENIILDIRGRSGLSSYNPERDKQ